MKEHYMKKYMIERQKDKQANLISPATLYKSLGCEASQYKNVVLNSAETNVTPYASKGCVNGAEVICIFFQY